MVTCYRINLVPHDWYLLPYSQIVVLARNTLGLCFRTENMQAFFHRISSLTSYRASRTVSPYLSEHPYRNGDAYFSYLYVPMNSEYRLPNRDDILEGCLRNLFPSSYLTGRQGGQLSHADSA